MILHNTLPSQPDVSHAAQDSQIGRDFTADQGNLLENVGYEGVSKRAYVG